MAGPAFFLVGLLGPALDALAALLFALSVEWATPLAPDTVATVAAESARDAAAAIAPLERRFAGFGFASATAVVNRDGTISVAFAAGEEVPWDLLLAPAQVTIHSVIDPPPAEPLAAGLLRLPWAEAVGVSEADLVVAGAAITANNVAGASTTVVETGSSSIIVTLTDAGAAKLNKLTTARIGERVAIVLDGVVHAAPRIQEPIPGYSFAVTGALAAEAAVRLAVAIANPLPPGLSLAGLDAIPRDQDE